MSFSRFTRYNAIPAILLLYVLPILFLSASHADFLVSASGLFLFSLGMCITLGGACLFYLLLCVWEGGLQQQHAFIRVPEPITSSPQEAIQPLLNDKDNSVEKEAQQEAMIALQEEMRQTVNVYEQRQNQLLAEIQQRNEKINHLHMEYETGQKSIQNTVQELSGYKKTSLEQIRQKDSFLKDCQQKISEQQSVIEKLQHQVAALENKEQELNYEIKTLLQFSQMEEMPLFDDEKDLETFEFDPNFKQTKMGAILNDSDGRDGGNGHAHGTLSILRQGIEMAIKMQGVGSQSQSGSRPLPIENSVLDLRRLCDNLRQITTHPVLLYSQKESKMLFANAQIKTALGWTPEKFVQIFPEIVSDGLDEWRGSLKRLAGDPELQCSIPLKSKEGVVTEVSCFLGLIETGIFRNHVIAVLRE